MPTSDQVHEHTEERQYEHEDEPQRLGDAAHVMAPEDVDDDAEQDDEPHHEDEEHEKRPEEPEDRIVVRQHCVLLLDRARSSVVKAPIEARAKARGAEGDGTSPDAGASKLLTPCRLCRTLHPSRVMPSHPTAVFNPRKS